MEKLESIIESQTVRDPRCLLPPGGTGKVIAHCTLKTTGKGRKSDKWIFSQKHRRKLMKDLKLYLGIFPSIKILGAVWISNHGHIIYQIDYDYKPTRTELADGYMAVYGKKLHPNSSAVHQLKKDSANLSKLMQRFCHDTAWRFNRECGFNRTGHLWAERYHSTVLKNTKALLRCWLYVMFNPVKAGMTPTPLDYKFNTLTFDDQEFCNQCMQNFFEAYKEISGHKEKSLEEFKEMVLKLLEEEVEKWRRLDKEKKKHYKQQNHYWSQAHVVGTISEISEKQTGRKIKRLPHETDMPDQFWV